MNTKTDTVQSSAEALRYPWDQHPGPEEIVEVRPGVLWARLKLPFRLNHVNVYLLADGDGYAMVTEEQPLRLLPFRGAAVLVIDRLQIFDLRHLQRAVEAFRDPAGKADMIGMGMGDDEPRDLYMP